MTVNNVNILGVAKSLWLEKQIQVNLIWSNQKLAKSTAEALEHHFSLANKKPLTKFKFENKVIWIGSTGDGYCQFRSFILQSRNLDGPN